MGFEIRCQESSTTPTLSLTWSAKNNKMTTRHNKSKERRLIFAQFALLAAQIMRQALRILA